MEKFFNNPGFIHIGLEIFSHLTFEEIINLRAVSPIMKNFVEQMDICHPMHWLKKCVEAGMKKETHEKWVKLIHENLDMKFLIFGMVKQIYKDGIKRKKNDGKWAESFSFEYFGGPCRSLYNIKNIDIFEKNFNFLRRASMLKCCFSVIVGPLKSKDGKYGYWSSVLPENCRWNKRYRGEDRQDVYDRNFLLEGDPKNVQEPMKVIKEYIKVFKRKDCTDEDYKSPSQKRIRLIK